jgi:transposase InsO family protein
MLTAVEYVTKWEEAKPVESCTKEVAAKFIYKDVIIRFGCPLTLINDHGTHFVNETIKFILDFFLIDHIKTTTYHPQENGAVESFNKTLHKGLTNICGINNYVWDDKIHAVLWAYRSAFKISTGHTPFNLVYDHEFIIPLQSWTNSDRFTAIEKFDERKNMNY